MTGGGVTRVGRAAPVVPAPAWSLRLLVGRALALACLCWSIAASSRSGSPGVVVRLGGQLSSASFRSASCGRTRRAPRRRGSRGRRARPRRVFGGVASAPAAAPRRGAGARSATRGPRGRKARAPSSSLRSGARCGSSSPAAPATSARSSPQQLLDARPRGRRARQPVRGHRAAVPPGADVRAGGPARRRRGARGRARPAASTACCTSPRCRWWPSPSSTPSATGATTSSAR